MGDETWERRYSRPHITHNSLESVHTSNTLVNAKLFYIGVNNQISNFQRM